MIKGDFHHDIYIFFFEDVTFAMNLFHDKKNDILLQIFKLNGDDNKNASGLRL